MHRHNTLAELYLLPCIENGLKAMTERRLLCEVVRTVTSVNDPPCPSPAQILGMAAELLHAFNLKAYSF